MSSLDTDALTQLAESVVQRALDGGATVAEAQARAGWELSVRVRLGETELVQEAGHKRVALRVLKNERAALTSTSDVSEAGLERCVRDALELLELSEPDPFSGPADPKDLYTGGGPDLDLYDPKVGEIDADYAIRSAKEAEAAALASDARLTLSEGATFSRVTGASAMVLSTGFSAAQVGSYASLTVSPVAMDEGDKRRRGYYWTASRHLSDLQDNVFVGKEAARRTLQKLGPRKVATTEAPIIFDNDNARSILGTFAGCILGGALWRRSSYLLDRIGSQVCSPLVTIVDNPLLPRAPGSRLFDGDGLPSRVNTVVDKGILKSYLLDTYSARKLGLQCTASGSRGGASVSASTTNLILSAGEQSLEALIKSTPRGLLVTDMMGFGFNAITGDFSRGASGFWIENGEIAFAVSEVTISGNLDKMLQAIDAVGNDLDLRTSIASPSLRVAQMTISGT